MTIVTPNQQPMPSPDATYQGVPFTALLCVEGLETSDGRMFELGSTTWRDLPLPFMVQDTTAHGEDQTPAPAWAAGQLDDIYRDPQDPSRIMGHGHFMPNAAGQRALELMQHAFRGISVDAYPSSPLPPEVQPTMVDETGQPIAVLVRYNDSVISRATMVPTPAFASCCAWLDDEDPPQVAQDAHGQVTPISTPPQVMEIADPYEQLVASSGGPAQPPRDWFFVPEPDEYQPMETSPDGQITGHLAPNGTCHLAYVGKCETAPKSTTNPPYKAFHRTVARCADGTEVACGWLTIDTKHEWDFAKKAGATADYYDHTGTLVAKLRASNGKHGIWACGAVVPGLGDREAWLLQGPEVSGDWRRYDDPDTHTGHNRELISVLAVPVPGFPGTRTRPELLVASGEIVAQRGTFEPCDCDEEGDPMTPEERAEFDTYKAKVDALVASGATTASGRLTVGEEFAAGIDKGIAAGTPELQAEADLLIASMDGTPTADLTEPLTAAEYARYVGRYDAPARALMSVDDLALRDGTIAIGDEDDLIAAARHYRDNPRAVTHIRKVAARLGRDDLASDEWPAQVVLSKEPRSLAKYSADQLKAMLKKGQAMPPSTKDGQPGYPIGDADDLAKAIKAVGRGAGSHNDIRKHVMAAAKRLKMQDQIPDNWSSDGSVKAAA